MSVNSNDPSQPEQMTHVALNAPLYGASMGQAVRRFFSKYTYFKGYASRSEYWWVQLVLGVVGAIVAIPSWRTYDPTLGYFDLTQGTGNVEGLVLASSIGSFVLGVVTFLPLLALSWRRLHDAGFPGPLYFLGLIPFVGWLIVLVLMLFPTRVDKRNPEWEYAADSP